MLSGSFDLSVSNVLGSQREGKERLYRCTSHLSYSRQKLVV